MEALWVSLSAVLALATTVASSLAYSWYTERKFKLAAACLVMAAISFMAAATAFSTALAFRDMRAQQSKEPVVVPRLQGESQ